MPTVLHPRALAETDGSPPARVSIDRTRYVVDREAGGLVDLPSEALAEQLAADHGVSREAIDPDTPDGESESDETTTSTTGSDGTCAADTANGSCGNPAGDDGFCHLESHGPEDD